MSNRGIFAALILTLSIFAYAEEPKAQRCGSIPEWAASDGPATRIGSEVENCWGCFPVESTKLVCGCLSYNGNIVSTNCPGGLTVGASGSQGFNTCGDSFFDQLVYETVVGESGQKKGGLAMDYPIAQLTAGHSSSFQQWWNNHVESNRPAGSSTGQPYTGSFTGTSSASNSYSDAPMLSPAYSIPYTMRVWTCWMYGSICSTEADVTF